MGIDDPSEGFVAQDIGDFVLAGVTGVPWWSERFGLECEDSVDTLRRSVLQDVPYGSEFQCLTDPRVSGRWGWGIVTRYRPVLEVNWAWM